MVISVISACVGSACCAPDPQRHLGLRLAHLGCDFCGLVVPWSGWHWGDGSHRTSSNPWRQNCSPLHKFRQDLDQLLNKKRSFSICMQSPHLLSCAASRGGICKHLSTFIAMLLPVQCFTEIHSDFPFLQGCLLIFFQLSWPSGNWNRRVQTPCQRFCFTVLWCSLWLSDEYQFNYTWEPWLSFLLLNQKCGNEFQLLLKNCYSATIKYRISTVHGLFYSPSKLNSIKLHVCCTVRDRKLLQSHVACGNALHQEIVNASTTCPEVPFAEAPFKLVWVAAGVINTSLYSGHFLWKATKGTNHDFAALRLMSNVCEQRWINECDHCEIPAVERVRILYVDRLCLNFVFLWKYYRQHMLLK